MIKELKIQAFSFEVPILDTLVIVCYDHNTDHAIREIVKLANEKYFRINNYTDLSLLEGLDNKLSKAGFVKEVSEYAKLIVHYLDIDEMNSRLSGEPIEKSIVHEVCHITQRICRNHQVNDDEFFAYLTEYIYDKILEQVDEEYKQEKSKRESDLLEATKEIPS